MVPQVDVVVLTRSSAPLHADVERGLQSQRGVRLVLHRIVGSAIPEDRCRWDPIVRARNAGVKRGRTPWLMFLDDDVVLHPTCVASLVAELSRRPVFAALAADYLGESRQGNIANHVAMGATLFRRASLQQFRFTWRESRCECQCCCDDLRRRRWGIDYFPAAKARHLPKAEIRDHCSAGSAARNVPPRNCVSEHHRSGPVCFPKVCLLVPYFGLPPGWINLYLLSCAHNPSIDFIIFTDQDEFPAAPPNVRVERLSRSSFETLATDKLGIKVRLSRPYKLCDFRPTFGHLFEEYLEGCDYWGYTDLDVIYGDIRRFLSIAKLQDYDVFSGRREYLAGHFTLLRNSRLIRMLYEKCDDYRATLQAEESLSFDECGNQWRQRLQGLPLTDEAACDSLNHVVNRMQAVGKIRANFAPVVIEWPELTTPDWRLRWHAGRLWRIDQRHEAMYFHFNAYKQRRGYREPPRFDDGLMFDISAQGFEPPAATPKRRPVCVTSWSQVRAELR